MTNQFRTIKGKDIIQEIQAHLADGREEWCKQRGILVPCSHCGKWPNIEQTDSGYALAVCENEECDLCATKTERNLEATARIWNSAHTRSDK